jgi:hypothetical protein
MEATLARLGLHLHPDKTRIVCLRNGAEGFDFLGHADLRVMPTSAETSLSGAAAGRMGSA